MKITVIMPAYNAEMYIADAIESWLAQSINEKELICIDDGSTDNTVAIIESFIKKYSNIRLFTQENKGAGAARNLGLANANGEFVAFLDADDFYLDNCALEKMYNVAKEDRLWVCVGLIQTCSNGDLKKHNAYREILGPENKKIINYVDFQADYFFWSYIYSNEFLKKNSILFPDFKRYQDPPFLVQALYYAEKYAVVDVEFYAYRIEYKTVNYSMDMANDMFSGLLFNMKFAADKNLDKLLANTIERINVDCFNIIYNNLIVENKKLLRYLLEAGEIADDFGEKIEPLEFLLKKKSDINYDEYLCIYKLKKIFKQDDKILIYGFGNMGRLCVDAMLNYGYGHIVAVIDKNKHGQLYKGYEICDLNGLNVYEYDFVLIMIADEIVSLGVSAELQEMGTRQEKIVEWCKLW